MPPETPALDAVARRILEAFDQLARERLDLHALLELAGGANPADREAVLDAVPQLVQEGKLRSAGGDFYARTEDGRIALAGPRAVTIYTRPDCHLCEEAKAEMAPTLQEFGAVLREVNVDADAVLQQRYGNDVPVVFIGSREAARHRVNAAEFRKVLARAKK